MLKEIIDLSIKTATITRYSQSHLTRQESVLEHTGFVVLFCYIVGSKIYRCDMGELLRKAVSHDLEESIVGDIATPTKYSSDSMTYCIKQFEDRAMKQISNHFDDWMDMHGDWRDSKDDTIEGKIVTIADHCAVIYKIYEETVIYNNRSITSHAKNLLPVIRDRFEGETNAVLCEILMEATKICKEILEYEN